MTDDAPTLEIWHLGTPDALVLVDGQHEQGLTELARSGALVVNDDGVTLDLCPEKVCGADTLRSGVVHTG